MKKIKEISTILITVLSLTVGSLLEKPVQNLCCHWAANGCIHIAEYDSDTNEGDLYTSCGDGVIYVGSGLFGGCPAYGFTLPCDGVNVSD